MKILLRTIATVFLLAAFSIGAWWWYEISYPQEDRSQDTMVRIESGSTVADIASALQTAGVIEHPWLFQWYVKKSGTATLLQAGEFIIPAHSTMKDIVKQLSGGEGFVDSGRVTLIEGWTAQQMLKELNARGFELDDYSDIVAEGNVASLYPDIDPLLLRGKSATSSLEGYLFPDTYEFKQDVTASDVIAKQLQTFDRRIDDELSAQIEQSDMSFFDILTLASIVEKEVSKPADRRIVAGIFLERLEDEYLLQSDATVNYVSGKNNPRPTNEDLDQESFYNTYKYTGLPPGPICNPGVDAITAVLDAKRTDYYYFLTTPEGDAVYSKTYAEHLQNKARYYP